MEPQIEGVEVLHAAVAAFEKRELTFRDILHDLPAAIYTTDADGRLTYYNKACVEFSGRTPTLGNDRWCVTWKLLTADGEPLAHADCPMAVALREGREIRGVEATAVRPDGYQVHFMPYPTPIRDRAGNLIGAVNMLVDITERKEAERRIRLMARETNHRANNLLAVAMALVKLSVASSVKELKKSLEARLKSLANVNTLIADGRWESVDLRTLVLQELQPFDNVTIEGPALPLSPVAAQAFSLMIHELATNAVKFGALSSTEGSLRVAWSVDDHEILLLRWIERGGPTTAPPGKTSTGTGVIDGAVKQLKGELFRDWTPTGLECTFVNGSGAMAK